MAVGLIRRGLAEIVAATPRKPPLTAFPSLHIPDDPEEQTQAFCDTCGRLYRIDSEIAWRQ